MGHLALGLLWIAATAFAAHSQSNTTKPANTLTGTPQQRAACGPDVGKFCKSIKSGEGAAGYVSCLVENRGKLSEACRKVLDSNQQQGE
jgi:hypothetical protein